MTSRSAAFACLAIAGCIAPASTSTPLQHRWARAELPLVAWISPKAAPWLPALVDAGDELQRIIGREVLLPVVISSAAPAPRPPVRGALFVDVDELEPGHLAQAATWFEPHGRAIAGVIRLSPLVDVGDRRRVVLHELAHVLGLPHGSSSSVMWWRLGRGRALSAGEQRALQRAYR